MKTILICLMLFSAARAERLYLEFGADVFPFLEDWELIQKINTKDSEALGRRLRLMEFEKNWKTA